MAAYEEIGALVSGTGVALFSGYAPTGTEPPYAVHRPLYIDPEEVAVAGDIIAFDYQTSLYCCGASVDASFNMALLLMRTLNTARVDGSTLTTSMGYIGAQVEGHYETQVTVQLNTGGI